MKRIMLKSKIHRATVTDADLHYEGSITVDKDLMEAARLVEFEQVEIYNISNGNRFSTYVIHGESGNGDICLNGAAARLVSKGDLIIICSYSVYDEEEVEKHAPALIYVDEQNSMIELDMAHG